MLLLERVQRMKVLQFASLYHHLVLFLLSLHRDPRRTVFFWFEILHHLTFLSNPHSNPIFPLDSPTVALSGEKRACFSPKQPGLNRQVGSSFSD